MRIAPIAEASGNKQCTPHMTGGRFGFLYAFHFVSALPNGGFSPGLKDGVKEIILSRSFTFIKQLSMQCQVGFQSRKRSISPAISAGGSPFSVRNLHMNGDWICLSAKTV
jgi:hypothetical protein